MNKISGTIPPEIGLLTALTELRVPPASPTHGAARDRPSASQVPRPQPDHRPDPERGRQAHGAEAAASSPRVPTPGAARDRASASQAALRQPDRRYVPGRALRRRGVSGQNRHQPRRPVRHELLRCREWRVHDLWRVLRSRDDDAAASSPRAPDARRGARPTLGVAGSSGGEQFKGWSSTIWARSRPRSASSRR